MVVLRSALLGVNANTAVATHTQPRACKSPTKSQASVERLLTARPAVSRLGHAEPLVGLWRRHHYSNRPVHPPFVRQALARRLAVLACPSDRHKLGGALLFTSTFEQELTRVDHDRIQGPWSGQSLRRRLRHVAHQAACATWACLWPRGQVRGSWYLRRHIQEQPPRHRVPLHRGYER